MTNPQPDRSPAYPAFRAWIIRLVAYSVTALAAVIAALAAVGRLMPETVPALLTAATQAAVAWVLGRIAEHVVRTLLYDRQQAAWQELRQKRGADAA